MVSDEPLLRWLEAYILETPTNDDQDLDSFAADDDSDDGDDDGKDDKDDGGSNDPGSFTYTVKFDDGTTETGVSYSRITRRRHGMTTEQRKERGWALKQPDDVYEKGEKVECRRKHSEVYQPGCTVVKKTKAEDGRVIHTSKHTHDAAVMKHARRQKRKEERRLRQVARAAALAATTVVRGQERFGLANDPLLLRDAAVWLRRRPVICLRLAPDESVASTTTATAADADPTTDARLRTGRHCCPPMVVQEESEEKEKGRRRRR